jgi:hypothetical protein
MKHLVESILSDPTTSSVGNEYPLSFGHDGLPCPDSSDVPFDVVDSSGFHSTRVRFCECTLNNRSTQLLKAGFIPTSIAQPQLAFSFELLKLFYKLNHKVGPYDFIECLTDNVVSSMYELRGHG